jgi:REP element-mobilizing transposase RayT
MVEHRHLPHVSSFRDNPIVFFTTCTQKRRKLLACAQSHVILRGLWERSAERDGWWVGHYILMPDHVHFFARRATIAQPMAKWMQMWKSVSSRQLAASLILRRLSGNRIILIAIFDREKTMARNGIMWSKMRCERD